MIKNLYRINSKMKEKFTREEIKVLKKIAQDKIEFEKMFLYDKDEKGNKILRGNYEDWAMAMRRGGGK